MPLVYATKPRSELRLPNLLVLNRNFALLWAAYGISALGDHLSEMGLLIERNAQDSHETLRIQALIQFAFFLPFVVLGPLAGWWADRYSRKWTMIGADLVRAVIMGTLMYSVPRLGVWLAPHGLGDFSIALPLAAAGVFAAFFSPSRQALIPTLIRDDQLVRANALISALGTIAAIASALLGSFFVEHYGRQVNYRLDALSFLLSAALLTFIQMARTRALPRPQLTGVWTPIVAGFRYVRQHHRPFEMILVGTVFWGAAGVVRSCLPPLVRDAFGASITRTGYFQGLVGIGLAAGAVFMTLVGPTLPVQLAVFGGLVAAGLWTVALDVTYVFKMGPIPAGVCLLGMGFGGAMLLVSVLATLQRIVPDSRRGRVFGVSDMLTVGAMIVATGALGLPHIPNLDAYVPWLLGVTGLAVLAAAVAVGREYLRRDPSRPAVAFWWKVLVFYARFWCRLKRIGPCTVPRRGPVIVAANHTTGVDPVLILATCTHRIVSFVVAREYYRVPIFGRFMRMGNAVPINRANPGKQFLGDVLHLLRAGGCLGIFPQGTFVAPDQPQPEAKPGIGVIALRTGATVIPCHISGTVYEDNPFLGLFRRHNARVRYGPPIDLSTFKGHERDPETPQRVADLILSKIQSLAASDALPISPGEPDHRASQGVD